jgi:ubiquinone/menaquinone biosynthesis C-methylase UbiE
LLFADLMNDGTYIDYAKAVLASYEDRDSADRNLLFDAVRDIAKDRVLDLGCGPGQDLIPFLKHSDSVCVGIDIGEELGKVAVPYFRERGFAGRALFVRGGGGALPFADQSFDIVLCRVALPYMDNRKTIAEVARVMTPGATFLLTTHAPPFYFAMIAERLKTLDVKQLAYPALCLLAGTWHSLTGKQLSGGIWEGKEIFQTRGFLSRELRRNGLKIVGELPDTNRQSPSFRIIKE